MGDDLKQEILKIMTPIFGVKVRNTIDKFYESREEELIYLAEQMLTDYLGPEQTRKIMDELYKKFPDVKTG